MRSEGEAVLDCSIANIKISTKQSLSACLVAAAFCQRLFCPQIVPVQCLSLDRKAGKLAVFDQKILRIGQKVQIFSVFDQNFLVIRSGFVDFSHPQFFKPPQL